MYLLKKTAIGTAKPSKTPVNKRPVKKARLAPISFVDLVDRYKYSVVSLEVSQPLQGRRFQNNPFFLPPQTRETAINVGTGFVFDKRGYILTNEHVVHGSEDIQVRFYGQKELVKADLAAYSYELDLAVLKVNLPRKTFHLLPFGKSSMVRVGEFVMAIGCPFNMISQHNYTRFKYIAR